MKQFILLAGFILIGIVLFAQKTSAPGAGGKTVTHTVQAKETLYSISRKYNVKVADIIAANKFDKNKNLSIGEKVLIPLNKNDQQPNAGRKEKAQVIAKNKEIPKSNSSQQATITGTNINIRKGPAADQPVIGTAQQDDVVTIIRKIDDEWTWIRNKEGLEGYIASQFLQPSNAKPAPEKTMPEKKAKITGTNINIRKGPSKDQPVIATGQGDDVVTIVKKVNGEWTEIRTSDGSDGFIASQFLTSDEADISAEKNEKINTVVEKIEEQVGKEKVTEKKAIEEKISILDDNGYFKTDYDRQSSANIEKTLSSGIFKTERGWNDGRYYILIDNVTPGTIVKVMNPDTKKTIYAKALGEIKELQYSKGFDIRISDAAAAALQIPEASEKFTVSVVY